MRNRILLLLVALALLFSMSVVAFAQDVPDLTRRGSIEISMHSGQNAVGGGTLTLYRVGEVFENAGSYSFRPAGDFADCGESLDDLHSAELAENLAAYAQRNTLSGLTKEVGQDGAVSFSELEPGLYLLVQDQAADGYSEVRPFLVSVPQMEDGAYVYEVDASPKVELTPEPTEAPTQPTPSEPSDPSLPQTGQLNWPIPLLAVLGLTLFAAGWMLYRKKDRYEK